MGYCYPNKIVIVGAGAAGLACAIAAATHGADVTLVEKTAHLGGTVAHSLIHTIGGLYDDTGAYINAGLPVQLAELLLQASPSTRKRKMGKVWTLSVDPALYQTVVERWVESKPNITVLRGAYLTQIQTAGRRVSQVEVMVGQQPVWLPTDALVDTTGCAALVRMLDATKVVEGTVLAGLIFQIRGVASDALKFPKNIAVQRSLQSAVAAGTLPTAFARTWFDIGVYDDEVYAKANLPATGYDAAALPHWQAQLLHFLQPFPGFSNAQITSIGALGLRDGGSIQGEYCLTLDDVKQGRTFADAVGRCAWPIEYWDPQQGVTLDYLPPGHYYEIPLQSLQVLGMENLWTAGKSLAAEKLAQASARVAGTCWAMGDALGKMIARQAYPADG